MISELYGKENEEKSVVVGSRMCEKGKWHVRGGGRQAGGTPDKRI